MFTIVAALLSADQNLMSPSLSAIATEFGMSDEDKDRLLGGYVSAIFFAVGAPAALAAGYLADRVHRPALMALVVADAFAELLAGIEAKRGELALR